MLGSLKSNTTSTLTDFWASFRPFSTGPDKPSKVSSTTDDAEFESSSRSVSQSSTTAKPAKSDNNSRSLFGKSRRTPSSRAEECDGTNNIAKADLPETTKNGKAEASRVANDKSKTRVDERGSTVSGESKSGSLTSRRIVNSKEFTLRETSTAIIDPSRTEPLRRDNEISRKDSTGYCFKKSYTNRASQDYSTTKDLASALRSGQKTARASIGSRVSFNSTLLEEQKSDSVRSNGSTTRVRMSDRDDYSKRKSMEYDPECLLSNRLFRTETASTALKRRDTLKDSPRDSRPADIRRGSRPTDTRRDSRPTYTRLDSRPADTRHYTRLDSRPADTCRDSRPADTRRDSRPADTRRDSRPAESYRTSRYNEYDSSSYFDGHQQHVDGRVEYCEDMFRDAELQRCSSASFERSDRSRVAVIESRASVGRRRMNDPNSRQASTKSSRGITNRQDDTFSRFSEKSFSSEKPFPSRSPEKLIRSDKSLISRHHSRSEKELSNELEKESNLHDSIHKMVNDKLKMSDKLKMNDCFESMSPVKVPHISKPSRPPSNKESLSRVGSLSAAVDSTRYPSTPPNVKPSMSNYEISKYETLFDALKSVQDDFRSERVESRTARLWSGMEPSTFPSNQSSKTAVTKAASSKWQQESGRGYATGGGEAARERRSMEEFVLVMETKRASAGQPLETKLAPRRPSVDFDDGRISDHRNENKIHFSRTSNVAAGSNLQGPNYLNVDELMISYEPSSSAFSNDTELTPSCRRGSLDSDLLASTYGSTTKKTPVSTRCESIEEDAPPVPEIKLILDSRPRCRLADFDLRATVGTGTFGRVRMVKLKNCKNQTPLALKMLKKSEVVRLKQVEHVKSEKDILKRIQHPFIVNLFATFQDNRRLFMVMEFVHGGELFSYLRRETKLDNAGGRFYASEITVALQYLHSMDIVYRDLKPENLLIDGEGHVKITDFGFAKVVLDRTWTVCGTPEYLAPEVIQSKGHGKSVDWWALGILIFEMLAGYPPFYDENPFGIYQKVLAGKINFPRFIDTRAKDLIKRLLSHDRTKRYGCLKGGAEDIKQHKWFKSLDWDMCLKRQIPPPFIPETKSPDDTSMFDQYPESTEGSGPLVSPAEQELFADF